MRLPAIRTAWSAWGLALLAWGCSDASTEPNPSDDLVRGVRIELVEPRSVSTSLRVPGLVEAAARIELAFRVEGFIEHFEVDEADRVEEGQVLARLDREELERGVRRARATLVREKARAASAERAYERQEGLFNSGVSSPEGYDEALSARDMAEASRLEALVGLQDAEDRLAKATLRAPVAGVIERRLLEPHERATPQTPVLVLTQLDPVKVRAAVADSHLAELRVGARASVSNPVRPGARIQGIVSQIDMVADSETRTVPFEVEVPNPDLALRPELVVDVEVHTGEPATLTLVPMSAVLRDAELRPFCFVLEGDDDAVRAVRRTVDLGGMRGERVVVLSGLVPGDRLVVQGQHFLREDDLARVVGTD